MPLDEPATPELGAKPDPALRFVILLGLLDAFGPLGIDMYLPAFGEIKQAMNAGGGVMELTLSLFLAGLAIGQLAWGPIADRFGRRTPLICGAIAYVIASAACAFTRSIEALIFARFVMGLAGSSGMVIARAVVRDSFEEADSSRVYSILMLVIGIAPILSPSIGGWIMGFGGWESIFLALAAFGCVCGVAVAVDLPETLPPERRNRDSLATIAGRYAELLVDRRFVGNAAPVSLALGLIFAYVATAPTLFIDHFKMSKGMFSLVFAGNAIGLIGVAQTNRWLTRRYDTHAILRVASLANAASALVLAVLAWSGVGGQLAFLAAIFATLTSIGLILPNATAAVMAPYPDHAGVASALMGMLQFAVGATAGALVGVFNDGTGRPMALVMAGCAVLSLLINLASEREVEVEASPVTA